ncbi:MAG: TerB family tellurite resistance protein [Anaerolineae bacterium]|nr:TerB family tellurite resistance protein [Anaerolineae bacterium]
MPTESLIMTLGKVIVAAAWADGDITNDELNSLKDLLFYLPRTDEAAGKRLTEQEWARLDIYIDSPVGADERARLIADLQDAVRTEEDKELVISTLEELVQSDGKVSPEEKAVLDEVKSALAFDTGFFGFVGRLVGGAVNRRSEAVANAPNREDLFEAFVKNKVYYAVRQRLNAEGKDLNVSDDELRKLSLAGGLMARVAHADKQVTDAELATIAQYLQEAWPLANEAAALVAEIAVSKINQDIDYFRLSRQFANQTTMDERVAFVDTLYKIAAADGTVSPEENAEVGSVAQSLNVTRAHLNQYQAGKSHP